MQVQEKVGRNEVAATARRLGLNSANPHHPSMALGAGETSLLRLTAVYATFANQGYGVLPHGILEVRDGKGNILYRRRGSGRGEVARPWHVAEMSRMLEITIQRGTGRNARIGRPAAGKTGTSQDYRDAWFLGYTNQLAAGVWLGNDNGAPMNRVTGGGAPARLWRDFMKAAHKGLPVKTLSRPGGKPPTARPSENLLDKLWRSLGPGRDVQPGQGRDLNDPANREGQ